MHLGNNRGTDLFSDNHLQELISRQGFCKKESMIGDNEINQLYDCFNEAFKGVKLHEGFNFSLVFFDKEKKIKISNRIIEIVKPFLDKVCKGYEIYSANFLIKTPTDKFLVEIHQDWSYTEEEINTTLHCWIPFCDTNIENGGMFVVPGTHFQNIPSYRAPNMPFFFDGNEELVSEYMQPLDVKRGEALFFDNSLIHATVSNNTKEDRVAIVLSIKQKDSQLIFLNGDKENKRINVYNQDNDYIFSFKNFLEDMMQPPKSGEYCRFIPLERIYIYKNEELKLLLDNVIQAAGYTKPINYLSKYKGSPSISIQTNNKKFNIFSFLKKKIING